MPGEVTGAFDDVQCAVRDAIGRPLPQLDRSDGICRIWASSVGWRNRTSSSSPTVMHSTAAPTVVRSTWSLQAARWWTG
jgi:hypothetical protein